ncbi:MAG: lysophospholipid acyltransferase family protein [bacterium]
MTRILSWIYVLTGQREKAEALVPGVMAAWCRSVFRKRRCTVVVEGGENLPPDQAFVVMANHQSRYDILLLSGYLGRPAGFAAKSELFLVPGISFWLKQMHSISIDRKDIAGGAAALEEHGRKMKAEGRGIIIFPEGTRTRHPDREIQPFKQGSLRLASDHDIPVVPVSLDGTRFLERFEYYWRTPESARVVRMKIAPPILPNAKSAPERKRVMESLRETIISNWKAIRVEWPIL